MNQQTVKKSSDNNRGLNLSSVENARDLGGYTNKLGEQTQWRRFIRTADMHEVTPHDQTRLLDYGISSVIDLRMTKETDVIPNVFENSSRLNFVRHDFWGTRFDDYRSANKAASPTKKLADLYCAGLEKSGFVMADIMATFASGDTVGYAFHCRSGKDRTGLVAAMLLAIADVPEETICDDYSLTKTFLQQPAINPIEGNKPGAWQRGCERETMEITLEFIMQKFGGVTQYLLAQGVSEEQLQKVRAKLIDPEF